jgi:Arc/MetJ-type ribon-helix-helix transcriptional regulator
MTIHLPEHLERYVHDQVQAGRYLNERDVICDALERHRRAGPTPAHATGQLELTPEEVADQELQRRLLAAGVISEIKPPPRLLPLRERFTPVPITGEPISETIIRERR